MFIAEPELETPTNAAAVRWFLVGYTLPRRKYDEGILRLHGRRRDTVSIPRSREFSLKRDMNPAAEAAPPA
jgi:hypothetical protein